MPHIRARAFSEAIVQKLSLELPGELSKIMQTPADNFTVEKVATQFYKDGVATEGDPMIEVLWFDRGQETKELCAKRITEIARKYSSAEFIAVVFVALLRESYFENGVGF